MIFERPIFGLLMFLIIPALIMFIIRIKRLNILPKSFFRQSSSIKKKITVNFIFSSLSWICLCLALATPYFGQNQVSVQKRGRALSILLDISHSMETKDFPVKNHSRLYAATQFAKSLLQKLPEDVPVSLSIVKGEGQIAIPLTEDRGAIENFLQIASPQMMSSPGSNLSAGILCAASSFPESIGMSSTILFFTDAEDLSGDIYNALLTTIKSGIKIIILGMGDKIQREILTGDGKKAMSALRENEILEKINKINGLTGKSRSRQQIYYINGADPKAFSQVINYINPKNEIGENATVLDTEVQNIPRFRLFLAAALLFFILGVIFSQLSPDFLIKISLISLLFLSCSTENQNRIKILSGVMDFKTRNYNEATAEFLKAEELGEMHKDEALKAIAGFNLATTFLIMNENDVASKKFETLEATEMLAFPIEFNKGIVAHRNGDNLSAARHFKNALKIDPSNIEAKINLEIVQSKLPVTNSGSQNQEIQSFESTDNSQMIDKIFTIIKEADGKQWKSQPKTSTSNIPDY